MYVLEFYEKLEQLRLYEWQFNFYYEKNNVVNMASIVPDVVRVLFSVMNDNEFISDKEAIDNWYVLITQLENAGKQNNYTYIYDLINGRIHSFIKTMLSGLFAEYRKLIEEYFWKTNIKVLQKRYPDIANRIINKEQGFSKYKCRRYGLRGSVLFAQNQEEEYDLYSEYSPVDFAIQVLNKYDFSKYQNIFMWVLGCDMEITAVNAMIEMIYMNNAFLHVYVVSMEAFNLFLRHTARVGILSEKRIVYHFEESINNFFQEILKVKSSYVYIGPHSLKNIVEKENIEKFMIQNHLCSNIQEKNQQYFC